MIYYSNEKKNMKKTVMMYDFATTSFLL